jgi:sulfonate transport system permease protein
MPSSRKSVLPWIVPTLLLLGWYGMSRYGWLSARILPSPPEVLRAAYRLIRSGELPRHLGISSERAVTGLLLGGTLGFALGLITGLFALAESLLDSTVQMIRTIPNLAMIPLVILWFGIGEEAKVFLIAQGVFFPIYLNTYHGIRTVDPHLKEMGRVYGLSPWRLFTQVIFPGALPSILVGLRFALGSMWLTLIAAEALAAEAGIGYMTTTAREFMQTDVVVVGTLLYALLGKLADTLARLLERRWLAWHPNYQRPARQAPSVRGKRLAFSLKRLAPRTNLPAERSAAP